MSCIVYMTNKNNGHMYAYKSESYRDPITRKPKSRRKYLGRVDPETKQLLNPKTTVDAEHTETATAGTHEEVSTNSPLNPKDYISRKEFEKSQETVKAQQEAVVSLKKELDDIKKILVTFERAIHLSVSKG